MNKANVIKFVTLFATVAAATVAGIYLHGYISAKIAASKAPATV